MVGYPNEADEQRIASIFNNFDKRKKGELDYDEIKMFLFEVFDELEEDTSQLNGDTIIGNIFKDEMEDILNSELYKNAVRKMPYFDLCKKCTYRLKFKK